MSIAENNLFVRFFLSLQPCLENAAVNSALGRACDWLERWFLRQAESSAICTFVWRESRIPRVWPHSIACRLFITIIDILYALFKAVYRAGERMWDASLFCRLIGALSGTPFLFPGLFIVVMLMTPHAMRNNVCDLVGAVALIGPFMVDSTSYPKHQLELDILGSYMTLHMAFICIALAGPLSTRLSLRLFVFHPTGFLLVLLVAGMVRKYKQLQLMVALAVLGLSVAALYGYCQSYIGVDIVTSQQDMDLNQGVPGRVYSFFDNPDNFAEQLAVLLPLSPALFLNSYWRGKLLSLLSLGMGLVTIGATYDRASWISLAGVVLVSLALLSWRWMPVFLLVSLAVVPFLPETIYNRTLTIFNAGEDSSAQYCFDIYETARNPMEDYWARGVGLGTDVMKRVFRTYPTDFNGSYPVHTHNDYLRVWGKTGVLGLLAYLPLPLCQLKPDVKGSCAVLDPRVKRMITAAIDASCSILVIGVAGYTWYYPCNMFTCWFLFGVIGVCIKLVRMEQDRQVA